MPIITECTAAIESQEAHIVFVSMNIFPSIERVFILVLGTNPSIRWMAWPPPFTILIRPNIEYRQKNISCVYIRPHYHQILSTI